jgi:hypothetical protein
LEESEGERGAALITAALIRGGGREVRVVKSRELDGGGG